MWIARLVFFAVIVIIPVLTLVASFWVVKNWSRLGENFKKFFRLFLIYSSLLAIPFLVLFILALFVEGVPFVFLGLLIPFGIMWLVGASVFLSIFFRKVVIKMIKQQGIEYELKNSSAKWAFLFPLILLVGFYILSAYALLETFWKNME